MKKTKELVFIQACPDDDYFIWQVHLWLDSLKSINHSDKAISLIFTPFKREKNKKWKHLEELFPEATFFFMEDEDGISKLMPIYIPILRPYILMKYFKLHPKLSEKAIFYCDSDILFLPNFNIDHLINDDVNYLSNTNHYINSEYFDSKIKDVKPDKLQEYLKRDILDESCKLMGISRKIAEQNKLNSGGAQYLLKNIDWKFWDKVITDTFKVRVFLQNINSEFFENENKGFQSWCADMYAVLWNIWYNRQETKVVKELDFCWSSDPISRVSETTIFHNAGVVSDFKDNIPMFYKGSFHKGGTPFNDKHVENVYKNEESKKIANWYYVSKIIELKNKYKINY